MSHRYFESLFKADQFRYSGYRSITYPHHTPAPRREKLAENLISDQAKLAQYRLGMQDVLVRD